MEDTKSAYDKIKFYRKMFSKYLYDSKDKLPIIIDSDGSVRIRFIDYDWYLGDTVNFDGTSTSTKKWSDIPTMVDLEARMIFWKEKLKELVRDDNLVKKADIRLYVNINQRYGITVNIKIHH